MSEEECKFRVCDEVVVTDVHDDATQLVGRIGIIASSCGWGDDSYSVYFKNSFDLHGSEYTSAEFKAKYPEVDLYKERFWNIPGSKLRLAKPIKNKYKKVSLKLYL